MDSGLVRGPTFLVDTPTQRQNLDNLQRREQHLNEQYQKNKPLCFSASHYQQTHPLKGRDHIDADAALVSPMLLGVCDGVSQIQDYGLDPSLLPRELLGECEALAAEQLVPDASGRMAGTYEGPIPLMRRAFEGTSALGSTTALLAILDNSSAIHGKIHPMIAVLSVGDCQIVVLRQTQGRDRPYELIHHTEMQRIEGHAQCPLQICRLEASYDPGYDDAVPIEAIERGSAVHLVSIYEGDIVVLGSDGVFDNLFKEEILAICNQALLPTLGGGVKFRPRDLALLEHVARTIVTACHAKTRVLPSGKLPGCPIGKGGKQDDTCCVVGEIVEWTDKMCNRWSSLQRQRQLRSLLKCGGLLEFCCPQEKLDSAVGDGDGRSTGHGSAHSGLRPGNDARDCPQRPGSFTEEEEEEEEAEAGCTIL